MAYPLYIHKPVKLQLQQLPEFIRVYLAEKIYWLSCESRRDSLAAKRVARQAVTHHDYYYLHLGLWRVFYARDTANAIYIEKIAK